MYFVTSVIGNPKHSQWNQQVCLVLLFCGFSIFKVREETVGHSFVLIILFFVIGGDVERSTCLLLINFPYCNSSVQISLS